MFPLRSVQWTVGALTTVRTLSVCYICSRRRRRGSWKKTRRVSAKQPYAIWINTTPWRLVDTRKDAIWDTARVFSFLTGKSDGPSLPDTCHTPAFIAPWGKRVSAAPNTRDKQHIQKPHADPHADCQVCVSAATPSLYVTALISK